MKKYVLPLLLFLTIQTNAQVNFVKRTWPELLAQAAAEHKYIFIDAYTDWCGWCKVLDKEVFPDSAVGAFMNAHFVNMKLEMEQQELGKKIGTKYAIRAYPTGLILDQEGRLVYVLEGYSPKLDYLKRLERAIKKENSVALKGYSKGFDVNYPMIYRQTLMPGTQNKHPSDKEVNVFLKKQKDKTSEPNWVVWKRFSYALDEDNKQSFMKLRKEFASLYGKQAVEGIIGSFIDDLVDSAAKSNNRSMFDKALAMADQYLPNPEDSKSWYRLQFSQSTKNWKEYSSIVQSMISANPPAPAASVNTFAWTIYEQCEDSAIVKQAIAWMEPVIKTDPQYAYLDTHAALLFKAKRFAEAEKYAVLAIETGKAAKEDVKATEVLLIQIRAGK